LYSFESGKNTLQGYLYGAENSKGLIVISHGLGGGAESYMAETMYFVDAGYRVFSYDNTGCYRSEGKNSVGLSQSLLDLDAALSYIESQPIFDGLPIYLYGHSWGGYAVTAILGFDHDIAASVSVSGFNRPMTIIHEWGRKMMSNLATVEYPFIWLYHTLTFGENANITAVDGINATDTPVLLIHGDADDTVSFNRAATVAARDEITNPNVQYKICSADKQNDHSRLYLDIDAINYIDENNAKYSQMYEEYDGKIPDDLRREFYETLDKRRTSNLDDAFMRDVIEFYEAAQD